MMEITDKDLKGCKDWDNNSVENIKTILDQIFKSTFRDEFIAEFIERWTQFKSENQSIDPYNVLKSENLNPIVKDKARLLVEKAREQGLNVIVFEGYRSPSRQQELYNQEPPVTNAKEGSSYHNYGLAVDIVFVDENGNPSWANHHDWKALGELAKELGFVWGGDFSNLKDFSHFEYHPGFDLGTIKKLPNPRDLAQVWSLIADSSDNGDAPT